MEIKIDDDKPHRRSASVAIEMDEVLVDSTGDMVKHNLLILLEKKMTSLQIAARYHEILANKYQWLGMILNYSTIATTTLSLILSTVLGENDSAINLPLAVSNGATLALRASQQYCDYTELAKAHALNHATATELADDIEYIILKNNHTRDSLQHALDIYDERIKSFRKTEEPIPLDIKHKYM